MRFFPHTNADAFVPSLQHLIKGICKRNIEYSVAAVTEKLCFKFKTGHVGCLAASLVVV